jgi:GAF domain-containing protein
MPDDAQVDPGQTIEALRRELAARTAERDEALAERTAIAEIMQIINRSPGDLAPVFEAMLESAMHLCEAACGHLYTFDGEQFHPAAVHGSAGFAEWWRTGQGAVRPTPNGSPLGRVAQGEHVVHIADALQSDGYRTAPRFRELIDFSGIRSGVTVALRKDGTLLGAITVYRQLVQPFTDKQIALLQNFAAQAVIAIENARLITETREALEQQTATSEVLQVINSSPGNLGPVFDAMLERACLLCEAEIGTLWTYEDEHMRASAIRGAPPAYAEFLERRSPHPISREHKRLRRGERFIHTADVTDTETTDQVIPCTAQRLISVESVRSWACRCARMSMY